MLKEVDLQEYLDSQLEYLDCTIPNYAMTSLTLLLLFLKKVSNTRLRVSDLHPTSQETPAPQYQPNQTYSPALTARF